MKKICEICGNEFDAKRESARFCNDNCRKKASRVSVTKPVNVTGNSTGLDVSVTKDSVTDISVTDILLGRDDKYSPNYELTEEAFIRRNKNWMDFSEKFRVHLRESAVTWKRSVADAIITNQRLKNTQCEAN